MYKFYNNSKIHLSQLSSDAIFPLKKAVMINADMSENNPSALSPNTVFESIVAALSQPGNNGSMALLILNAITFSYFQNKHILSGGQYNDKLKHAEEKLISQLQKVAEQKDAHFPTWCSALSLEDKLVALKKTRLNVNMQDAAGNTLMHYAIEYRQLNVVKALLSMNARLDIRNNFMQLPEDSLGAEKANFFEAVFAADGQRSTSHFESLMQNVYHSIIQPKIDSKKLSNEKINEHLKMFKQALDANRCYYTDEPLLIFLDQFIENEQYSWSPVYKKLSEIHTDIKSKSLNPILSSPKLLLTPLKTMCFFSNAQTNQVKELEIKLLQAEDINRTQSKTISQYQTKIKDQEETINKQALLIKDLHKKLFVDDSAEKQDKGLDVPDLNNSQTEAIRLGMSSQSMCSSLFYPKQLNKSEAPNHKTSRTNVNQKEASSILKK